MLCHHDNVTLTGWMSQTTKLAHALHLEILGWGSSSADL